MKTIYIQSFLLLFGILMSTTSFAQITGPTTVCANQSEGPYSAPGGSSFSWSMQSGPDGPSFTNQAGQTTNISFNLQGSYIIQCLVDSINYTYAIIVNSLDDASFNYSGGTFCQNGSDPTPTITGLSGGFFSSTGGLTINPASGQIDLLNSTPGTYNVTYSTSGACPNSSIQNVVINNSPDASFSYTSPVCQNSGNQLPTGVGVGAGTFSATPAGLAFNASTGEINPGSSTAGTYTVTNTISPSGGCAAASSTFNVTINATPMASIVSGPTIACNNTQQSYGANTIAGVTYSWSIDGGGSLLGASTQYCDVNFNSAGSWNLTMNVTKVSTGCVGTTISNITINPAPLASFSPVSLCNGDTATVSATFVSGATYSWSGIPSQMTNPANTQTIQVFYNSGNNLNLTVTGANGCLGQQSSVVTVHNLPDATVTSNYTNLCAGGTANLYVNSSVSHSWTPSTGLDNTTSSSVNATLDTSVTYTVVITDAFGCVNIGTHTQNVIAKDSLILTASDVTSCVSNNGQVIASLYQPNNQPYSYSWSNSATTDTITNLNSGSYTLTLTNGYNCNTVKTVLVNYNIVYPSLEADSLVTINSTCGSANGSISGLYLTGGMAPYTYSWSNSATTIDVSGLIAGSYDLTYSDANGCGNISNYVVGNSNFTSITGTGLISGTPITAGTATLYLLNGSGALMQSINQNLTAGAYDFSALNAANYLLYIEADSASYPNAVKTYYNATNLWLEADTLSPTCGNDIIADVNVIETTPLSGSATISGIIYNNTSGKTTAQGDPVPGVDVSLEQNPGSVMLAVTSTDNNGAYSFTNVPAGNFILSVDVPGLPQVSTYDITITGNNTIVDQNFYVDSAGVIDTIRPIILKTKQIVKTTTDIDFIAYPNPFSDLITIQYHIAKESNVGYSIVNILGEAVFVSSSSVKAAGNYYYNLNAKELGLGAGIYFVRLEANNKINTYKIVKRD